eukprot:TRINITY_DN9725_c0_g1_i1.p1 TRINITY_DN9725_c0_g1~~TRINITY_DN9725_c0_g1_i1.p1  ORF type:complete len:273 (+),score=34.47 TRINITY_DN9725_c0_g1_i1:105-923(+)
MTHSDDCPIQTESWQGKERFDNEYLSKGIPVLLKGVRGDNWTLSNCVLPQDLIDNKSIVDVSHGTEETSIPTSKTTMTLSDYVRRVSESTSEAAGYLKQQDMSTIFQEGSLPIDTHDIIPSKYWCTTYFWMGPMGSRTGLHNDDEHSFLLQIYGTKTVKLLKPEYAEHCLPNSKYDSGTNCFDFDPFSDNDANPHLAPYIQEATLHPGDALLIPKFWLHSTQAASTSISLNIFVSTLSEQIFEGINRNVLHYLHQMGFYKPGNCVCHAAPTG